MHNEETMNESRMT